MRDGSRARDRRAPLAPDRRGPLPPDRRAPLAGAFGLLVVLACVACKDRPSAPPPPMQPAPPPQQRAQPALPEPAGAQRPSAQPALPPAMDASAAAQPITAEDASAAMPKLAGDVMIAVKATADGRQAHGTWCLTGTAADAVVHDLAATLATAGWTAIATRGDATKAGVSGERDGYRLSYVVSASSAATCRAPAHYFASATIFRLR